MSTRAWFTPNKLGAVLIACVVVGVIAIVAALTWLESTWVDFDTETNCPTDESTHYRSTVVLIDRTDPISPSQKLYLTEFVAKLMKEFALFEKVAVYSIEPSTPDVPLALFQRCTPGSPDRANPWVQNPEQIRERFELDFSEPFNQAIERSIADATANTSPIMETIQAVMANHGLDERISQQRLILVSDMLQNVPEYSQYRTGYSYGDFLRTAYASRTRANLLGVQVTLVYLWRPSLSPDDVDAHVVFWEQFFRQNGGSLAQVQKVR